MIHRAYMLNAMCRRLPGLCPNAEAFYAEELSLPLFPDLEDADIDRVVGELVAILA